MRKLIAQFGLFTISLAVMSPARPFSRYPESVLKAVSPFLELFSWHLSSKVDKIFQNWPLIKGSKGLAETCCMIQIAGCRHVGGLNFLDREFDFSEKTSGNEIHYTNALLLLIRIMLYCQLHNQRGFDFILFSS